MKPHGTTEIYQWHKADYRALNEYLGQVDWDLFVTVNLTGETIWTSFSTILTTAFDLFVCFWEYMASRIIFYSYIAISLGLIRISDIANSK